MNVKHLVAYFKERFPPINMMLFAILFFTVYSVALFFNSKVNVPVSHIILGVVATISFFYRLRVFDEMKDFKMDAINHPNRVLQSGKVSLRQLVVIALLLLIVEISWSLISGLKTVLFWSIAVAFSLLMRYEFFISNLLKRYLLLYSFTHMLIMPLIIIWLWSAYVAQFAFTLPLILLCLLSILGGYSFELARKIHARAAERELVDSYSKSIGFIGSIISVCLCLLAGIITQFYLLTLLDTRLWPYYLLGLLYLVTLALYIIAIRKQHEKQLRLAEVFVSLFMLISYVSIIIEIKLR